MNTEGDDMFNQGNYYKEQKDYKNMKKYYLMAIEKGNSDAKTFYYDHGMEKWCSKGCSKSSRDAMNMLGYYYYEQKDYENMKKYYLMAIEKGDSSAMNNLGKYYYEEKDYENMIQYYLMAIEKGDSNAMNNLGYYYLKQKEFYSDYYKINYFLKDLFDNLNNQGNNSREYAKEALDKYNNYKDCKNKIYNLVKKELENNTSFKLFYNHITDDIINKLPNYINLYNDAKLLFEKNLINYKKQLVEYAKLYAIGIKDPSYLNVK